MRKMENEMISEIKKYKSTDEFSQDKLSDGAEEFRKGGHEIIKYEGRKYVPNIKELKENILTKKLEHKIQIDRNK